MQLYVGTASAWNIFLLTFSVPAWSRTVPGETARVENLNSGNQYQLHLEIVSRFGIEESSEHTPLSVILGKDRGPDGANRHITTAFTNIAP